MQVLAIDNRSTGLSPPRSKNTRIVRLREEYVVTGDIDRNTGSSLYSRDTTTHMSIPSRRISDGRIVLKRCSIQRYCNAFCSRCVRTRLAAGACAAGEMDTNAAIAE